MARLTTQRAGMAMGVSAYAMWGLLPAYLKLLRPLPPVDILSHRIIWSLLLLAIVAVVMRRGADLLRVVRSPRLLATLTASALLICANWLLYVYAINSDHVLQASIGYFINPLVNVVLGVIVLRERLGRVEVAAVLLAATGVAALTIYQHAVPLLSLALALTFGLYGLVRKMAPVDALEGLLVETALLGPLALAWLLSPAGAGLPAAGPSLLLVASSGLVTAAPLLLFAGAAKRIRYADLGLLQYLAPSLQLLLAVAMFHEPLLPIHLVTFAFIWSGLALYASASWRRARAVAAPE
jgi:chloramphenicol-sensitive protein RarD